MSRFAYLFHPSIQLIKFTVSGSALQITSAGFQFLLHDPHAQLWDLLLEYLHMAEVKYHGLLYRRDNVVYDPTGTSNGCRRGSQLSIHAVHDGAWKGMQIFLDTTHSFRNSYHRNTRLKI